MGLNFAFFCTGAFSIKKYRLSHPSTLDPLGLSLPFSRVFRALGTSTCGNLHLNHALAQPVPEKMAAKDPEHF